MVIGGDDDDDDGMAGGGRVDGWLTDIVLPKYHMVIIWYEPV